LKLAALSPAIFLDARLVKKNWNCQAVKMKHYFSLKWTKKQHEQGWKLCSTKEITLQCKAHLKKKKTTPQSWLTKLKATIVTPILHNFPHNHQHIFYITIFDISYR